MARLQFCDVPAALDRMPVVRVVYRMFARPSVAGDILLCLISAGFAAALIGGSADGPYDSDGWFLLATGREIVENGIPYTNPWAYDAQGGGYSLVVQQWLHATALYGAYLLGGYSAVDAFSALMAAATAVVLYATARTVSRGAAPAFCAGVCAVALMGCSIFFSVRPHMWTMMCLCAVVCVCVVARRKESPWLYALLPLIMLFHAQVHMSMMWLDVFAATCFLLPWGGAEASSGLACFVRERIPLAVALAAMALAAFVNPYGLDGALYLLHSMGAAGYRDVISELHSILHPDVAGIIRAFFVSMLVLALIACAASHRLPPVPFAMFWVVAMTAFAVHIRCVWIASVATMLLLSCFLRPAGVGPDRAARLGASSRLWTFPLASAVLVGGMVAYTAGYPAKAAAKLAEEGSGVVPLAGWEQVEGEISPFAEIILAEEEQGRVYVSWETASSVLEWEGVKVVFDVRPEIWEPGITHVEGSHPWRDYVDARLSDEAKDSYIRGGGWRWYVVTADEVSALCDEYGLQVEARTSQLALLKSAS